MITLETFSSVVAEADDSRLVLVKPDGEVIPAHFHITEVAHLQRDFIDCGGTRRNLSTCVLQVYIANDFDHRLACSKLGKILQASAELLPDAEMPVEFEIQTDSVTTYGAASIEMTDGALRVVFEPKATDCLAKDKCGIDESQVPNPFAVGASSGNAINPLGLDAGCCTPSSGGT